MSKKRQREDYDADDELESTRKRIKTISTQDEQEQHRHIEQADEGEQIGVDESEKIQLVKAPQETTKKQESIQKVVPVKNALRVREERIAKELRSYKQYMQDEYKLQCIMEDYNSLSSKLLYRRRQFKMYLCPVCLRLAQRARYVEFQVYCVTCGCRMSQ